MWGKDKTKAGKNSQRVETPKTEKKSKKSKSFKSPNIKLNITKLRNISSVLDGSILTSDWMVAKAPFFFFLFFLALIYIANNFVAQSKVKTINSINKELKGLHDEHISVKSDLMYFTKRSQLAKRLEDREIKEATKPPFKIFITKKEDK